MKLSTAVSILASAIGVANACTNDFYEHCTHYVPKSDSDPYIQCSSKQPCVDACNARMDKCGKLLKEGKVVVGCVKLSGNVNTFCVGFETTCKFLSSLGYDLFSMDAEKDRSPVPLSEIDGTYAHQNVL